MKSISVALLCLLFALRSGAQDVTKPTISITSPTQNQRWSNAVFTVKGTANDNVQVSNVWCQLNNEGWEMATGTTKWTNYVTLTPGTNLVRAYAVDSSSNQSVIRTNRVIYVVSDRLTLVVSPPGSGTVSGVANGQWLNINLAYTATAKANAGFVFSNWTGGVLPNVAVLTNSPTLKFLMVSNLVLQANIIPNPFIPVAGTYQGLFYDNNNGVEQASSGFFNGTVSSNGVFTAQLQQGLNSYPLSGQFSPTGAWFTNSIAGAGNVSAWLQLDLNGQDVLTGVLSNSSWTAQLTAARAVYSKANPAPQAGKYTVVMPGNANATVEPGGNGFGSVNVDTNGNVTFLGTLGDGTKVTQSSVVSKQGQWPLYLALYSGKGSLLGWLTFTNEADRDIDGLLSWIKPAGTTTSLYPAGFTNGLEALGSVYTFTNGRRALDLTNGVLILDNGNLAQELTNSFVLGTNNALTGTNLSRLTITNTTGLFGGTLTNPATRKAISISGAVLQKLNAGYGCFLGTDQSGSVELGAFLPSGTVLPTSGMVLIPAGPFTMGNSIGDSDITDANPTVVYVSAFYMDTNLVSYSQWQSLYGWARIHGYGFANAGAGKTANHPVGYVSWYDTVKWCNARSQQAGLAPVYYTDAGLTQVYTKGEATPYVDWTVNGYRLPTEAEWEKAARGGLSGQRFPWGDTISESQATYYSVAGYGSYDLGPNGYNSIGLIGGYPYASPVGSFAPNGYGLYDMAGNVNEWCWDWYGTPYAGGTDPHGPTSGSGRALRGGVWYGVGDFCRSASRWTTTPENCGDGVGFRVILGAVQTPGAPVLRVALTSTNTVLMAWPVGAVAFTLQQNADLKSTNWVNVGQSPAVVGGENQMTVVPPTGNRFYRLKGP